MNDCEGLSSVFKNDICLLTLPCALNATKIKPKQYELKKTC